ERTAITRPDGSRVIIAIHIDPVADEHGSLLGAIACVHEMTGGQSAVDSRGESDFCRLLEVLPAAVYATDAAGRITFYNRAAAELAGREPKIGSEYWCVTERLYRPDGTYLPHDECPMAVALRENRAIRG